MQPLIKLVWIYLLDPVISNAAIGITQDIQVQYCSWCAIKAQLFCYYFMYDKIIHAEHDALALNNIIITLERKTEATCIAVSLSQFTLILRD